MATVKEKALGTDVSGKILFSELPEPLRKKVWGSAFAVGGNRDKAVKIANKVVEKAPITDEEKKYIENNVEESSLATIGDFTVDQYEKSKAKAPVYDEVLQSLEG